MDAYALVRENATTLNSFKFGGLGNLTQWETLSSLVRRSYFWCGPYCKFLIEISILKLLNKMSLQINFSYVHKLILVCRSKKKKDFQKYFLALKWAVIIFFNLFNDARQYRAWCMQGVELLRSRLKAAVDFKSRSTLNLKCWCRRLVCRRMVGRRKGGRL